MYLASQSQPAEKTGEKPFGKAKEKLKERFKKDGGEDKLPPLEDGPYIKNGKPNGRPTLSGKKKLEFEKEVYRIEKLTRISNTAYKVKQLCEN